MKKTDFVLLILICLIIFTSCHYNDKQVFTSRSPLPTAKPVNSKENGLSNHEKEIIESKLLEDLKSSSAQTRWNAAVNLGMMRSEKAVQPLIQSLKDDNGQVRLLAAWALGRIGDKSASADLVKALEDTWIEVRPFAVWALGEIRDPATVEPLGKRLFTERETGTREAIIRTLGKIGDSSAVPFLISALKDDDENVRTEAANALGYLKDKRAVKPLMESLNDEEKEVVVNSLIALNNLRAADAKKEIEKLKTHKDQVISYLSGKVLYNLENNVFHPVNIGDKITNKKKLEEKKIEEMTGPDLYIGDISAANPEDTHNLGTLPIKIAMPINIKECLNDLKSQIPHIRSEAAWLLGNSEDKSVVPYLITALSDEKSEVRWNAAKSLGKLGDSRALIPLIKILDDPDKDVREDVIEALGRLKDGRAVKHLMEIVNNRNEHAYIRAKGVEALGRLGNYGGFDPLLSLLNNPSPKIRISAVIALGRLKDKRAPDHLEKMKSDPDKTLRECVITAVEVIKGKMDESELDTFDHMER